MTMSTSPRMAIVGTGAIGGYYGGRLAHASYPVHFFARSDVNPIRENGLRVDSPTGNFTLNPVSVSALDAECEPFDWVIVAVKTTANAAIAPKLAPLLHAHSRIIVIQNGFDVEKIFADHYPQQPIIGALAFICATKRGPGWIDHQDYGALKLGIYRNLSPVDLQATADVFQQTDLQCQTVTDLRRTRWEKLVWNIPFAGLCIVHDCLTQGLLKHPERRQHLRALMLEVIHTAQADGCAIDESLADTMLTNTDNMVDYTPSTLLDVRAGNPFERETMFEAPYAIATKYGINTPHWSQLLSHLKTI